MNHHFNPASWHSDPHDTNACYHCFLKIRSMGLILSPAPSHLKDGQRVSLHQIVRDLRWRSGRFIQNWTQSEPLSKSLSIEVGRTEEISPRSDPGRPCHVTQAQSVNLKDYPALPPASRYLLTWILAPWSFGTPLTNRHLISPGTTPLSMLLWEVENIEAMTSVGRWAGSVWDVINVNV